MDKTTTWERILEVGWEPKLNRKEVQGQHSAHGLITFMSNPPRWGHFRACEKEVYIISVCVCVCVWLLLWCPWDRELFQFYYTPVLSFWRQNALSRNTVQSVLLLLFSCHYKISVWKAGQFFIRSAFLRKSTDAVGLRLNTCNFKSSACQELGGHKGCQHIFVVTSSKLHIMPGRFS